MALEITPCVTDDDYEEWRRVRIAVVRTGLDGAEDDPARSDGILVLDAEGRPTHLLPVADPETPVVVQTWIDRQRLLVQVGDDLLTWDLRDNTVSRAARVPEGATVSVSSAQGLLAER